MNNIEQALKLLNDDPHSPYLYEKGDHPVKVLCRAIEAHEAFKQEVSDVLHDLSDMAGEHIPYGMRPKLRKLISPKPQPDPLFEVLGDLEWYNNSAQCAADLRAALEARGLEIVLKAGGQDV